MHVDKIIIRAACTTLAVIVTLFAFMTLALCFVFPSTMMQLTFDMGMNSASVKFARRAYEYSGEVYYAAFATEVAILDGDIGEVAACGKIFVNHEGFDEYCNQKNEKQPTGAAKYEQYIYGQVYAAEYSTITTTEKKAELLDRAFSSFAEGTFPVGNAVVTIAVAAKKAEDAYVLNAIREKMNTVKDGIATEDLPRFNGVLQGLGNE